MATFVPVDVPGDAPTAATSATAATAATAATGLAGSEPAVLVLTPEQYTAWRRQQAPRIVAAISRVAAEEDDEPDAPAKVLVTMSTEEAAPPKATDPPATVLGEVFDSMHGLRARVKEILQRGNPLSKHDHQFLVALLQHHPKARIMFADAAEAPDFVFKAVPTLNGDVAFFLKMKHGWAPSGNSSNSNIGDAGKNFMHFPHKLAIKALFPISSLPRRQDKWGSAAKKRKRGGGGGSDG
jgi:hypothetical protein